MTEIQIAFDGDLPPTTWERYEIVEELGKATQLSLDFFAQGPVEVDAVLGKGVTLTVVTASGTRAIRGVATSFLTIGSSRLPPRWRYRVEVHSGFAVMELRRRTRVFQQLSVPDVVKAAAAAGGYGGDAFAVTTSDTYAKREYLVQYLETDAAFVRRICEEEGLYFRFEEGDRFLLEDDTTKAKKALDVPLVVVPSGGHLVDVPSAHAFTRRRRRRPGKVTLRDYDPTKPALSLEAVKSAGTAVEKAVEVYEAPGRFTTASEGTTRATRRLEELRADVDVLTFDTRSVLVAPGLAVTLTFPDASFGGAPDETCVVTRVRHKGENAKISGISHVLSAEAVPVDVRYRLPRVTPRPLIHGVHSAIVTGAGGEEIHVEKDGCVHVRFHWDREGPTDHTSSLPVRVLQPNTPGSMLIPRVGWEVLVAFENADPDKPYVVGRVNNNQRPPPFPLPANKTVTSVGTVASPGAKRQNVIHFDDAAGKQNISIAAGFGKFTDVANHMMVQTANNENLGIKGSQSKTIAATDAVSVKQAYINEVGSQSATVGGLQAIYVKGDVTIGTGSESVMIGGACVEQVGNPVSGALQLLKSKVLAGIGAKGKIGAAISKGYGLGEAGYKGYKKGGVQGAVRGVGVGALTLVADTVPGGGAVLGAVIDELPAPWSDKKPIAPGAAGPGGGAAGASNDAAAKGPGPGYRNTVVEGVMTELVGGMHGVATPGSIGWTTIGASTTLIGAACKITCASSGSKVLGASTENLGSLKIDASESVERDVTGAIKTTIAGGLTSKAGAAHSIKSGSDLTLKSGGALTLNGGPISFICGDSHVVASADGVEIKATTITITGVTKQSKPIHNP